MTKRKFLSLFLSLVLVFTSFSGFGAYAVNNLAQTQPVEATRVREIEEHREVNSQTYLMSDGKYQCVIYAEDKFYEASNGKLVEIDNAISTAKHTRGDVEYAFKNKAGKSDVYFSDATGNILINAEKGTLSFAPKATRSTAKTVLGTKYNLKAADFVISGDDVIAYTDAYENTDIVYQVTNSGVKEYTVLKAKPETNAITYVFEHEGLKVSQGKKTVSFTNENGDEVFSLGTLFALDGAGNYTEKISYKLNVINEYTTEITVALDESYIESASFPIVIDPTVMVTGQTNTYDTFTSSKNPNTNYYMNTYLRTGCDAPFGKRHTYMRFVLPSSLNGKTIATARLNIRVQSGIAPTRVQLRALESSWTTNTLTWNNEPDSYALAYNLTLYQNNWYRAILTDMVQDWIDGDEPNYGFILKDPAEGYNYNNSITTDWTTFYSSDAASPNKPELVVEYPVYYGTRPYQFATGKASNCMGYALEVKEYITFEDIGVDEALIGRKSLSQLEDYLATKSEVWMDENLGTSNYASINTYNSSINTGWYRVVLRVGFYDYDGDGYFEYTDGDFCDYHWWYQTSDGNWADKLAANDSELKNNTSLVDPTDMTWSNGAFLYNSTGKFYQIKDMRDISW